MYIHLILLCVTFIASMLALHVVPRLIPMFDIGSDRFSPLGLLIVPVIGVFVYDEISLLWLLPLMPLLAGSLMDSYLSEPA